MDKEKEIAAEEAKYWRMTTAFNAGVESYRVYTNQKTGETVMKDGKNQSEHIKQILNGDKL